MKSTVIFLTLFFILISNLFSQELTFCDNGQKKQYSKISTKKVLLGFTDYIYEDDIDELIKIINLKVFTYKNDILIIDKSISGYRDNGSVENIILKLSKETKEEGIHDLIYTLKEMKEILYANPFYYENNYNDDLFSYQNKLIVKLKRKISLNSLDQLSEKYHFDYEYSRYGNSIKIEILSDADIDAPELTCILYYSGYFEYVQLLKISLVKRPTVIRY